MNKRVNTLLFVLGATLFNVIVAVVSFFILFILYIKFIYPFVPESTYNWTFSLLLLGSIAVSILVYRAVLKRFLDKFDIEKYLDPIFVKRNIKKS